MDVGVENNLCTNESWRNEKTKPIKCMNQSVERKCLYALTGLSSTSSWWNCFTTAHIFLTSLLSGRCKWKS